MFKDKPDEDEVRGHGDGVHAKRGELLAEAYPQEEVEQRHVQEIVEEVGTAEADAVFRRGLLVEGEVGREPVVHKETEHVADGIGHVHVDPVLQDPVYDVVEGG